jgi:hypothetical protein
MLCLADPIEDSETRPRSLAVGGSFSKGASLSASFIALCFFLILCFFFCVALIFMKDAASLNLVSGQRLALIFEGHPLWSSAPAPEPMVMSAKLTASPINSSDKRILPPPYYFDDSCVAQYEVIYQDQDNASKMKRGGLGRIVWVKREGYGSSGSSGT